MSSSAFADCSQLPSSYSLSYRLEHSPPSGFQTTDEDAESHSAESPNTTSADDMPGHQQAQTSSTADGSMFGAGSQSGHTLDWSEINDVAILRSSPPTSKRFSETINKFVSRGLSQQPQAGEGHAAAVKYYFHLASAFERTHDFSAEQACKAHDLMVDGWLQHVSEIVGQHLRSPERIVGFLDDVITNAEIMGGAQPPAMLRLALHNAISNPECPAPPTPHSQSDHQLPQAVEMDQHSAMDVTNANMTDAEMADAECVPHTDSQQQAGAEDAVTPASKRFPSTKSLFLHHSKKAKKSTSNLVQETDKRAAKAQSKVEWDKMDLRTRSEWEDLFACYERGDQSKAHVTSTAHLFEDGVATCVWSNTNTSSPVAEAGPSSRRSKAIATETPQDKTPIRPAHFHHRVVQYGHMDDTSHVSFLALKNPAKRTQSLGLAKACRAALAAIKGGELNLNYKEHELVDRTLFLIRWCDVKAARLFEGITVRVNNAKIRAQAYPDAPPQMFVAHMNHISEHGIRLDAVHPAIAHAVPGHAFHLRHEKIDRSNDTVWIVVFQQAPNLLRFAVGVQTKIDKHRLVDFEPLMRRAVCPVCHQAHSAADCDLLKKAGKHELGLKKRGLQNYIGKMPELS